MMVNSLLQAELCEEESTESIMNSNMKHIFDIIYV